MPRVVVVLVILSALAGRAAGDNLRLSPASPSSQSQAFTIIPSIETSAHAWYCRGGGGPTTRTAPISFDVDQPVTVRIRLEDGKGGTFFGGGVLAFGTQYICTDDLDEINLDLARGHYELYPYGNQYKLSGLVRFELPGRAKAEIARALTSLPTLTLGTTGALNPTFASAAPTASLDASDAGETCLRDRERGTPIANVDLRRSGPWMIHSTTRLFIKIGSTCYFLDGDASLDAGRHVLWAVLPAAGPPPATFPLEIDDRDAPLAVADAPHHALGALDAPLVVDGTVHAEAPPFSREVCREMSRAPDFYVTADRLLQAATISPMHAAAPQSLSVLGPIGPQAVRTCGHDMTDGTFSRPVLEGTYAVWVSGAAGDHYHVLVTRDGVTIDPLTLLITPTAAMPIAERKVTNYYPYFDRVKGDHAALYLAAPDALFVYARADVAGTTVRAGEPLLVDSANDIATQAWRYDGTTVGIGNDLVTGNRPATLWLPTTVDVPAADSVSVAEGMSGPEDHAALDVYDTVKARYKTCYEAYVDKHDPTVGHNVDVYRISGDQVVNVSDEVSAAADRTCNKKRVDAAEKQTLAALARTRADRWKARLARARARFGL